MAEILVMATPINGLVAFVNKDLTPVQLQRLPPRLGAVRATHIPS